MNLKALHENVHIKLESYGEEDLLLADEFNKSRPITGEVISVGNNVPKYIYVGQKVLFEQFVGTEIPKLITDGEDVINVHYQNIMGEFELTSQEQINDLKGMDY